MQDTIRKPSYCSWEQQAIISTNNYDGAFERIKRPKTAGDLSRNPRLVISLVAFLGYFRADRYGSLLLRITAQEFQQWRTILPFSEDA